MILIFTYKFVTLSSPQLRANERLNLWNKLTHLNRYCVCACAECPRHDSTNKKITANYIYYTFVRSFTHWASIVAFNGNDFRSVSHNCMLFSCLLCVWTRERKRKIASKILEIPEYLWMSLNRGKRSMNWTRWKESQMERVRRTIQTPFTEKCVCAFFLLSIVISIGASDTVQIYCIIC